jgi:hypothetical protein
LDPQPLARLALDRYLLQRDLPVARAQWNCTTPLIGSLENSSGTGITTTQLLSVIKRFSGLAADEMINKHSTLPENCGKQQHT